MATRIGRFFQDLFAVETAQGTAEASKATFELAESLQKPEIRSLAPIVQQGGSLLEVLNSPLGELIEAALPFVKIATGLLKFYLQVTQTEPTLTQEVALLSQAAYLESFQGLCRQSPKFLGWLNQRGDRPAPHLVRWQFQDLDRVEVDDRVARLTLLHFHESPLALAFNRVLSARLTGLGLTPDQANRVAERVAKQTNQFLLPVLAEMDGSANRLVRWYQMGGQAVFEKYLSIDTYLEDVIKLQPQKSVFNEGFSFQDIYVPLQGQLLQTNGDPDVNQPIVVLEDWVKQWLSNPNRQGQGVLIQAEPGRGKSVFCRIFADWVRQHEHPRWTPILLQLRELRSFNANFEVMLRDAIDRDFAKTDPGWLNDRNTSFLFLLDGFDELLLGRHGNDRLESFLQQVSQFQQSCGGNGEKKHRVLLTGRTAVLQNMERLIPPNFDRIEILPLDTSLQQQWFAKWKRLVGEQKAQAFQQFLADEEHCPSSICDPAQGLVREPLLLYLLAAMHRDGKLQIEMFEGAKEAKAKILIYERSLEWVLTKQRQDGPPWEIAELEREGLRILMETGLCVMQTGGESAPLAMVESRLNDHRTKELLAEVEEHLSNHPLQNAVAAFYLQPSRGKAGCVEFTHKSFGEFLCAKRLKEALEDWTRSGRRSQFEVSPERMIWKIYDLLGLPILTPEVLEYLLALLAESQEFRPQVLFQRLYEVYQRWCGSEYLDAISDNLPQKKVRLLRAQRTDLENLPGLRQVDLYTGFNLIILLSNLHSLVSPGLVSTTSPDILSSSLSSSLTPSELNSRLIFYPCGQPGSTSFNPMQLRQIIGCGEWLRIGAFREIVGAFLSHINLSAANLSNTDLSSTQFSYGNLDNAILFNANLSHANFNHATFNQADLQDAYLSSANFSSVDFIDANLTDVDLSYADLFDVNFSGATLRNADLSNADLSTANFRGADLSYADFSHAVLEDIEWDQNTCWQGVRGLDQADGLPEALKQQLNLK